MYQSILLFLLTLATFVLAVPTGATCNLVPDAIVFQPIVTSDDHLSPVGCMHGQSGFRDRWDTPPFDEYTGSPHRLKREDGLEEYYIRTGINCDKRPNHPKCRNPEPDPPVVEEPSCYMGPNCTCTYNCAHVQPCFIFNLTTCCEEDFCHASDNQISFDLEEAIPVSPWYDEPGVIIPEKRSLEPRHHTGTCTDHHDALTEMEAHISARVGESVCWDDMPVDLHEGDLEGYTKLTRVFMEVKLEKITHRFSLVEPLKKATNIDMEYDCICRCPLGSTDDVNKFINHCHKKHDCKAYQWDEAHTDCPLGVIDYGASTMYCTARVKSHDESTMYRIGGYTGSRMELNITSYYYCGWTYLPSSGASCDRFCWWHVLVDELSQVTEITRKAGCNAYADYTSFPTSVPNSLSLGSPGNPAFAIVPHFNTALIREFPQTEFIVKHGSNMHVAQGWQFETVGDPNIPGWINMNQDNHLQYHDKTVQESFTPGLKSCLHDNFDIKVGYDRSNPSQYPTLQTFYSGYQVASTANDEGGYLDLTPNVGVAAEFYLRVGHYADFYLQHSSPSIFACSPTSQCNLAGCPVNCHVEFTADDTADVPLIRVFTWHEGIVDNVQTISVPSGSGNFSYSIVDPISNVTRLCVNGDPTMLCATITLSPRNDTEFNPDWITKIRKNTNKGIDTGDGDVPDWKFWDPDTWDNSWRHILITAAVILGLCVACVILIVAIILFAFIFIYFSPQIISCLAATAAVMGPLGKVLMFLMNWLLLKPIKVGWGRIKLAFKRNQFKELNKEGKDEPDDEAQELEEINNEEAREEEMPSNLSNFQKKLWMEKHNK